MFPLVSFPTLSPVADIHLSRLCVFVTMDDQGVRYVVYRVEVTPQNEEMLDAFLTQTDISFEKKFAEEESEETTSDSGIPAAEAAGVDIAPREGRDRCPHCFCQPCVIDEDNRQMWWPRGQADPHRLNTGFRKDLYKRFWVMLLHRGAWTMPEYVEKREQALQRDARRRVYVWSVLLSKRDIMPDCVIKFVRTSFPNPRGIPYLGHTWH